MRFRTAKWMEVDVHYRKVMEDGMEKPVTEKYVVDALSFSEGETKAIAEMSAYVQGECDVKAMKAACYKEILFSDDSSDDLWWKVKLNIFTINENTGKEAKSSVSYLVQAGTLQRAVNNVMLAFENMMVDYTFESVTATNVVDVFELKSK